MMMSRIVAEFLYIRVGGGSDARVTTYEYV